MEEKGESKVCPRCGYTDGENNDSGSLSAGTVLNDRYLIGKVLSSNGEGVTYIAFDRVLSCKVCVREYYPIGLCTRVSGSGAVSVEAKKLAQYKTLMSEFTELHKQLAKMRTLSHLTPSLNIFDQNNTVYVVFEYIDGMTLKEYLKENAGELSWQQVSKIFPPLFTTISMFHNAGLIHRGISPDTIYITNGGELKLTGFSIAAVHTANSELKSELYSGYAAPEQYNSSNWQGTWTDVYSICAVLYRILTGCMPTDAADRANDDTLCKPSDINSTIPRNVSRAIFDGMRLLAEARTQDMTELVTKLFEEPTDYGKSASDTKKFAAKAADKPKKKAEAKEKTEQPVQIVQPTVQNTVFERIKVPLMIAVLLLASLMIIAVIAIELMFPDDDNSSSLPAVTTTVTSETTETTLTTTETSETTVTTSAGIQCKMNNLLGKVYEEIVNSPTYVGFVQFERVDMFDTDYDRGLICWQEIDAGDYYKKGSTVKIGVSCGKSEVAVPEYNGKGRAADLAELEELGLTNVTTTVWDNTGKQAGMVCGTSIEPGEMINIKNNEQLIVYYAAPTQSTAPQPTETTAQQSPAQTQQTAAQTQAN